MFVHLVVLAGLIIGSLSDIKTREVPDTLNFGLIAVGLVSGLFLSLFHETASYFISSLLGFLAGVLIGVLLFYTGQWGGGDAKMIMGIGALAGLSISEFAVGIPFFFLFIINSLLIGAFYGLIWVVVIGLKKFKDVKQELASLRTSRQALLFRKTFIVITLIVVPLIFILGLPFLVKFLIITGLLFIFIAFHASIILRAVEQIAMSKKVSVSKLTEGDWVIEEVRLKNNKIFSPPKTGVSYDDIKMLKDNNIKKVVVKEGIPFVPSFLMAYIITFFFGNWFHYLF